MTDEELAEIWVTSHYNSAVKPVIQLLERAYIAGLEAGKPNWHDLRKDPNDLPKSDERFINKVSVTVLSEKGQRVVYYFDSKEWYSDQQQEKVTAWTDLPKFEDA